MICLAVYIKVINKSSSISKSFHLVRYALCFTSAIGIFLMILFASYVLYVSGMYWKYRHIPSPRRKR